MNFPVQGPNLYAQERYNNAFFKQLEHIDESRKARIEGNAKAGDVNGKSENNKE